MTPKKQVSPAIRILRGERDASARATHLEAATRKFLVTTNERKYMSTTTNFKRIALVAVAALGMGVLSSVPSQAAVTNLSVTAVNGTATTGQSNDTVTAAIVSVSGLITLGAVDTITVTFINKGTQPGTGLARMYLLDTDLATAPSATMAVVDSIGAAVGNPATVGRVSPYGTASSAPYGGSALITGESFTATGAGFGLTSGYAGMAITNSAAGISGARFAVQFDSVTAQRTQGVYNYTAIATSYTAGAVVTTVTTDFTITIAATASEVNTIAPGSSTAFIASTGALATADVAVSALATASSTAAAVVRVNTFNANGTAKPESITATISGAGVLSYGGVTGASLTGIGDADGSTDISVLPNGTAGVATITITTTTRSFSAKTMSFYAAKPATLVASVPTPLLGVGTNADAVRVVAKDSAGVNWAGTLYVYASAAADAAIAGSAATAAVACTYSETTGYHSCPVTGNAAGTAKMKVMNYATTALSTAADAATAGSTVTSNEVSVVVSAGVVTSVKLEFDKASYAPGERARIYVTPLDSTGKAIQAGAYANLLATGGISTAQGLTFAGSTTTADSLTAVSITTKANSSSTSGAKAGSFEYTVYMPVSGGTVTISATGGTSLPIAGRVAVTASATVTDSGAAALAAVNALATTVASLKTLITTLTNLVLKIQKKVKA
jgi:hypothetical protein